MNPDLYTVGEFMGLFIASEGKSVEDANLYEFSVGGAEGNVASTLSPSDIAKDMVTASRWVHTTSILSAISKSARESVDYVLSPALLFSELTSHHQQQAYARVYSEHLR